MNLLTFDQLFDRADSEMAAMSVAVAGGDDPTVLHALAETTHRHWTRPILCGPADRIENMARTENVSLANFKVVDSDQPAVSAVELVRRGEASLLMKGQIATPDLMRAVLKSDTGLRTGRTICQIVMMEVPKDRRHFLLADTGITIEPSVDQALQIVESTAALARSLGCTTPRIAIMAASEKVTDAMPETRLAERIRAALPESPPLQIQGPLSFDLAYSRVAGEKKQLSGDAIGAANAMVFPSLLAANLTVKAIMYTADCRFGGLLAGAACPIVFMSRADDTETRIRSLALAISQASTRQAVARCSASQNVTMRCDTAPFEGNIEIPMNMNQLHLVTGAAGVGKSTFGKNLASKHAAILLDSDTVTEPVVRAGLAAAGMEPTDRDSAEYKRLFRDAVYECLFNTAADNLPHVSVVIVGPFTRELGDANWPAQLRSRFGVEPTVWYITCDDELRRQRIERRGNPRDAAKLRDWSRHIADAPVAEPVFDVMRIDTGTSTGTGI